MRWLVRCLVLAARLFRPPIVKFICEQGAAVNHPDADGWTALHWACSVGDARTAAVLLTFGADGVARSKLGLLPRHLLSPKLCDGEELYEIQRELEQFEQADAPQATHSLGVPVPVLVGPAAPHFEVEVRAPEKLRPGP